MTLESDITRIMSENSTPFRFIPFTNPILAYNWIQSWKSVCLSVCWLTAPNYIHVQHKMTSKVQVHICINVVWRSKWKQNEGVNITLFRDSFDVLSLYIFLALLSHQILFPCSILQPPYRRDHDKLLRSRWGSSKTIRGRVKKLMKTLVVEKTYVLIPATRKLFKVKFISTL